MYNIMYDFILNHTKLHVNYRSDYKKTEYQREGDLKTLGDRGAGLILLN